MTPFTAQPHALLVPFDGGLCATEFATKPPAPHAKSNGWKHKLEHEAASLADAQYRMFADGRYAMLIVLQAIDAGGKDGAIRHVFDRVNPCGLRVASFKAPSATEAEHDFLWRTTAQLPRRGELAIFNRSYYEEVLVVRVHPELLIAQSLPSPPPEQFWAERCRAIVDHERHLAQEGTVILKFWLSVSKAEQRRRLLERIDEPEKHWKFRFGDLRERDHWDDYHRAYAQCLGATSRPWAPWYAIPADDKHYARWQIARLVNDAFEQLDVAFPELDEAGRAELRRARSRLERE